MAARAAVVKLGGSVLTDKTSGELRLERARVRRFGEELVRSGVRPLVLVHGAGAFGHHIVERSGIHRGLSGPESRLAFGETQRLQYVLDAQIAEILLACGLPVMPMQASSSAILRGGALESLDLSAAAELVRHGMIPLYYGVPAVDRARGCSILSGDLLAARAATLLDAPLLVHLTNTDGVFDADPTRVPAARRIPRIDRQNWDEVRGALAGSSGVDVTGGMSGKVTALLALAQSGTPSRIVSGLIPGRLAGALAGEEQGTLICWEAA